MRLPIPWFVQVTVALTVAAALVITGFQVFQFWDTRQTPWGTLSPADRDLLVQVRHANLWEIPTARLAQQQGTTPRVREVGALLEADHTELDRQVRELATQLGVPLPNEPTADQRVWVSEIAGSSGAEFDRTFVQRLRIAHGKILPVVAEVRGSTENELIRAFATTAGEVVTRHMEHLESTGQVDSAALPAPPTPHTTGLPPTSVSAPEALPAEVLSTAMVAAEQSRSGGTNQSASAGSGVTYLAALLTVVLVVPAGIGLLVLLRGAFPAARQGPPRRRRDL